MKFSINRQKTIEIIGEYSNILKDNPVKPSLAGLFIQAKNNQVVFKGANTEIELIRYANCEIESEGQVLIKPALLLEYVKLLEGENINFEKKDGYLIVNNAEFSILDDNTYPELTEIIPIVIASENTVKFTMSLEKVKFLTNSSASTDTLFNSIKMIFKDNILELVSTDSFRLIYMKKELNNTINKDILVPGDSIAVLYKIFKDLDEEFSLAASDDRLIVTWKDAYFTCKLLSLSFPDFRPLINNTNNEGLIVCYISDISVFESYLDSICERLEKKEPSAMDGQVWGGDFIEDRVYIYWLFDPDNEEGKAEISRKGMLKLMKKWIEFRKKKIPENYEEYEEIIEVD